MTCAEIDMLTAMQLGREARQVTIDRHDSRAVLELDDIAVSALFACETHSAFAGGAHRRAHWRGIVDALVRANPVEDRVGGARLNRELMRENCTGARMNALRRLLPSGEKYSPCWPSAT